MSNQSSSASQSDSGSQSISVGANSGQIQAMNAGRDATVSGAMGGEAQAELSQAEAVKLVALIEAADLPAETKEEAGMYSRLGAIRLSKQLQTKSKSEF